MCIVAVTTKTLRCIYDSMVTHINFAVDDDLADRAKQIKDDRDLTWPQFLALATDTLDQTED